MSDLTTRLNEITARQDATNDKLDLILAALADLVPAPGGAALADVVSAINTGNARLQLMLGTLTNMQQLMTISNSKLDAIAIDVASLLVVQQDYYTQYFSGSGSYQLLENIGFGLQDVRQAIIATACLCDTSGPILPTTPGVNPFPSYQEQLLCKRAQRFVEYFETDILTPFRDILSTYGVVTVSTASAALAAALTALAPETLGGSIVPALVLGAIALALGGIASSQVGYIVSYYNNEALRAQLVQAIYSATDANQAKQQWDAVIDNFDGPSNQVKMVWKLLSLQMFFNATFDENADINVDGYDGTLCSGNQTPQHNFMCKTVQFYNGQFWENAQVAYGVWDEPITGSPFPSATNNTVYSEKIFATGNFQGFTVGFSEGTIHLQLYTAPLTGSLSDVPTTTIDLFNGEAHTITLETTAISVYGTSTTTYFAGVL